MTSGEVLAGELRAIRDWSGELRALLVSSPHGWQPDPELIAQARKLQADLDDRALWAYNEAQFASGAGEKSVEQSAMKRYQFYARADNVLSRLLDSLPAPPLEARETPKP